MRAHGTEDRLVETRRQQIDDVASALFRERGYAATSVREIARAVDLQGASLYAHVASKEALLWSIVERVAEQFRASAEAAEATSGSAADRLAAFIHGHVGVVTVERAHAAVFLQDWRFLEPEHRAAVAERREAYEATLRAILRDGAEDGSLRPMSEQHAAIAGRAVLAALNGIPAWFRPDGPATPETIATAELAIFMEGLRP